MTRKFVLFGFGIVLKTVRVSYVSNEDGVYSKTYDRRDRPDSKKDTDEQFEEGRKNNVKS